MTKAFRLVAYVCLYLLSTSLSSQESATTDELLARGKYLTDIAGCKACHTVESGDEFGGGKVTKSSFGVFYSPNISSDETKGIGSWSLEDFSLALTVGVSPSGEHYYPIFPYPNYQNLTQYDVEALYRYLLTTKPSQMSSAPHELKFPYSIRNLLSVWKWLYLEESKLSRESKKAGLDNGRYILYAVAHCDQCHSPRTSLGGVVEGEQLHGGEYNDSGSYAPSILPSQGGLKGWTVDDLETYLLLGESPNGDYAGGDMVDVIDHVTNYLSNEDIRQLAEYLISL
jgi:mono/diheme cytochrome c family protein